MNIALGLTGLGSAAALGASDFAGGVAAKRGHVFGVLTVARLSGLALVLPVAVWVREPLLSHSSFAWACAAGVADGLALAAFYRALAIGRMGVAAPIAAVLTAAFPVVIGVWTEGFPSRTQAVGLALALLALALVAKPDGEGGPAALVLALLAGIGFGAYLTLVRRAASAGLFWPMSTVLASALVVSGAILVAQGGLLPRGSAGRGSVVAGVLETAGGVLYLLAARRASLGVAATLTSLYPVVTVVLARAVLKERINRAQTVGMLAALVAVLLITEG